MTMTYNQLLKATIDEIEQIRRQPNTYRRKPLTIAQLEDLRKHLDSLYTRTKRVQMNFAYNIYMRAG
ncbi:MAG: hypothetical protein BWY74_00053 [Firmicutes bacterium ADurb.Bin419]|nr:MAG: hypothetical protein BWY74_00053 [Firmicutes bacterium ADurb.Bin419]